MLEKILFLIQFYFCVSIMCTLIFFRVTVTGRNKNVKNIQN